MPWDAPVCVNHHEAKAYCAWKSKQDSTSYRLPTETEWNLMKNKSISLKEARSNPEADPILTKSGFDELLVGKCLGHKNEQGVMKHYLDEKYLQQRRELFESYHQSLVEAGLKI